MLNGGLCINLVADILQLIFDLIHIDFGGLFWRDFEFYL